MNIIPLQLFLAGNYVQPNGRKTRYVIKNITIFTSLVPRPGEWPGNEAISLPIVKETFLGNI